MMFPSSQGAGKCYYMLIGSQLHVISGPAVSMYKLHRTLKWSKFIQSQNSTVFTYIHTRTCMCIQAHRYAGGSQRVMPPLHLLYVFIFFLMGATTTSVKPLNILDHILLITTVSLDRWQHHSWFYDGRGSHVVETTNSDRVFGPWR